MGDPPIHYGNDLPRSFSIFGVANPRQDDRPRGFFGSLIRDVAGDRPRYAPPVVAKPAAPPAPIVAKPAAPPPPAPAQVQVWEWQPHPVVEVPVGIPAAAQVPPEIPVSNVLTVANSAPIAVIQATVVAPPSPPVPKPAAAQPGVKQVCPVCMDAEPNTVLIPCGHMGYCTTCAGGLRTCPICRQVIRERVRTYNVAIADS